jgi:hypothetical protein
MEGPANPVERSEAIRASIRRLIDEARLDDVALLIDLWHVWDDELVWDFVGRASYRIAGVHVADWPDDAGRTDRVLPGEGSRTRRRSSMRSRCPVGTATSTWRSSPSRSASGRCRSRRLRARRTPL